jgi:hypothetical protein
MTSPGSTSTLMTSPGSTPPTPSMIVGRSNIHLWQFIKELLNDPNVYSGNNSVKLFSIFNSKVLQERGSTGGTRSILNVPSKLVGLFFENSTNLILPPNLA